MGVAWHRFLVFVNICFKRARRRAAPRSARCSRSRVERPADRLRGRRGPRRGRRARRRQGRGLHLEGPARLHHLHRVRPLPVAVPGLEHRQAAVPEAAGDDLRDHAYAKAPVAAGGRGASRGRAAGARRHRRRPRSARSSARPATTSDPLGIQPARPDAVIDPDVLWSCTTCGACVEQCPVDIEHVDHIVDMRRYQVLIESAFPAELGGLFKNLEKKANPWGMAPRPRMDWAKDLPFEVQSVGADVEDLDEVDYLFWVGCAGAFEDRAKKTTRAVAELLHTAGVTLRRARRRRDLHRRPGPARRQRVPLPDARPAERRDAQRGRRDQDRRHLRALLQHAQERVPAARRAATRCVHHTQLLNRLVRDGRLVPVARARRSRRHGRRLDGADRHLPRPLLPRPAQRRLRPAARADRRPARGRAAPRCRAPARSRSAAAPAAPGCGWRRSSARGSTPTAPRRPSPPAPTDRHRLPVLPGHAQRRAHRRAGRGRGAARQVEVVDVAQMLLAAVRRGEEGVPAQTPQGRPQPVP